MEKHITNVIIKIKQKKKTFENQQQVLNRINKKNGILCPHIQPYIIWSGSMGYNDRSYNKTKN